MKKGKNICNTIYYTTSRSAEEQRWTLWRDRKLTSIGAARIIKRKIGDVFLTVFITRIETQEKNK